MTPRFNCQNDSDKTAGIAAAREALAAKQCVVMPTDTVYGIAADAFSPQAVATLLAAKGRGRSMPPPVLIPRPATMDGLAVEVPEEARSLADEFWPGPLTLILLAQPSLTWDLGDTRGTVALRIPDDEVARELLEAVGPLAVSSANRSGQPAATTAAEAEGQLGESVAVYLEAGARPLHGEPLASTIVDCTRAVPRVVRQGALPLEELRRIVPGVLGLGEEPAPGADPEGTGEPGAPAAAEESGEPGTQP